ncbi:MFS transporter [bacterium]|nr:MFS transporter [bacterium]
MNIRILVFLSIANIVATLGQGLVVPLLPGYAHDLGASGFTIGLIFGVFSVSRSVLLPYFGWLSDIKGRKMFITAGLLFYFLTSIAYYYSQHVNALILIRFLQGIAAAMIVPSSQAYAGEISPVGKEGTTMGILNVAFYAGLGLGPIMGGLIKDHFGIRASFASMGLVCLAGFILCQLFLPPQKEERTCRTREKPENLGHLIRRPVILGLFLNRFSQILCIGILWTFMPLLAALEFHLSSSMIGVMISLMVLITALLTPLTGMLSDRVNKRMMMFAGSILVVITMLLFAGLDSVPGMLAATALSGLGGALLTSSTTAMAAVLGRRYHSMGSVMSLQIQGHSLGMFIGPMLAGIIMDFFDIRVAFGGAAAVMLVLSVVSLLLTREYDDFKNGDGGEPLLTPPQHF